MCVKEDVYALCSVIKEEADKGGKERNDSEESGCTERECEERSMNITGEAQSQALLCVGQCEAVKDLIAPTKGCEAW